MTDEYPEPPHDAEIVSDPEPAQSPGTELELRLSPGEIDRLLQPFTLTPVQWIRVLLEAQAMPESDPDEMALGMLAQIFLAETPAEVMRSMSLERARDLCGNKPGGRSPVIEFRGARALSSRYEEGPACYCIISGVRCDIGEPVRFTTGAKSVQGIVAKMMYEGWMPFKAALEIRADATQRGFHPLNLVFGI